MGNWETLMTMLGSNEARDEYSFILHQVNQDIGSNETMTRLLDKGNELYLDGKKGIIEKTKLLNYLHSLADKKYELVQPIHMASRIKGIPMKLSKRDLMDIYNAIKQKEIADDYYLAY